nr:MAG TPA: hypothetical protein [Caudoviricetes sp.]
MSQLKLNLCFWGKLNLYRFFYLRILYGILNLRCRSQS